MIRMIPIDEQQPRAGQLCLVLFDESQFGIGTYSPIDWAFGHDTIDGEVAFYEDVTHWLPLSLVQLGKGESYLDWGATGVKTSAAELSVPIEEAWHPVKEYGPSMLQLAFDSVAEVIAIEDFVGKRDQPFTDDADLSDDDAFDENGE